jgi:hypothetical protein
MNHFFHNYVKPAEVIIRSTDPKIYLVSHILFT